MATKRITLTLREAGVTLIDCEHKTPPAVTFGYPYVAIPQLKNGRINLADARRITKEHFIVWTRKASPKAYDVILSRRCNPGETAFVPPGLECALGQNLVLLRADGTRVFPPFLRWLVRGGEWWEQIGRIQNVGAVFDSLKCADIPNMCLTIPALTEQERIADILGTLDDKIELNRRMNETLEAMAQRLFRSWFVDFDPVHAKAALRRQHPKLSNADLSRRALPNMAPEIAELFPDRFEDSTLGPIPKGWKVKSVFDVCEFAYGKALKEEHRRLGQFPVYGSNGIVGWHDEPLVRGPGIIIGRKGNPGTVTWSHFDFFPIDTTFYVDSRGASNRLPYFRFALEILNLPHLSADSAVPGLNRNLAYGCPLLVPDENLITTFSGTFISIQNTISIHVSESHSLSISRDRLLPRLLSGQITKL